MRASAVERRSFAGAYRRGADLRRSSFAGCEFAGADVDGAVADEVTLSGHLRARLTPEQLARTVVRERGEKPPGG